MPRKKLFCKVGESKGNPFWLIALTSSTDTSYFLKEHEDVGQYANWLPTLNISNVGKPLN